MILFINKMSFNYKSINDKFEPPNLKLFCELTKNSYGSFDLDNTFAAFKTINDFLFLVYSTKTCSLICYDLINFTIIIEIKHSHKIHITNIRHFLDAKNKRDFIISISDRDNNLKLWNAYNWDCIIDIVHANNSGFLCSACILNESDNIYIITSNCNMTGETEKIKIYDFDGKIVKQIDDSNELIYFIDTLYDNQYNKIYLLTGNMNYIKSYDYYQNNLYHKYFDNESGIHISIQINKINNLLTLVESCSYGYIRIWNFHSAELLNKIKVYNDWIFGICLWDKNYAFVACKYKLIKLVNIEKGIIEKNLEGHNSGIFTIKKIEHPKLGKCLISQGYEEDQIKLWTIINNS